MTTALTTSPHDAESECRRPGPDRHACLVPRPSPPTRSARPSRPAHVAAWGDLIRENAAAIIGPIRQELLSGLASESAFNRLRDHLRAFEDIPLGLHDYEQAARFANKCRSIGLAGSSVDFLICAAAYSHDLEIFTTDRDFARYARCLPIRVHYPLT